MKLQAQSNMSIEDANMSLDKETNFRTQKPLDWYRFAIKSNSPTRSWLHEESTVGSFDPVSHRSGERK